MKLMGEVGGEICIFLHQKNQDVHWCLWNFQTQMEYFFFDFAVWGLELQNF